MSTLTSGVEDTDCRIVIRADVRHEEVWTISIYRKGEVEELVDEKVWHNGFKRDQYEELKDLLKQHFGQVNGHKLYRYSSTKIQNMKKEIKKRAKRQSTIC